MLVVLAIAFRGLLEGDDFSGFFSDRVDLLVEVGLLEGRCCWFDLMFLAAVVV